MSDSLGIEGETLGRVPDTDPVMGQSNESGREAQFDRLYRSFGVDVLAYCRRRVAPEAADDVLAETFLVVWRRLDDVPDDPRGWLLGIARRVIANQRRGTHRRGALVDRLIFERPLLAAPQPEPAPVLEALGQLGPLEQEALLLAAWDGLSSEEAGQVLGCSAVAFRLRLLRARRRLARALTAAAAAPHVVRLQPEEET
jgi:RNA polymerase sigma-70 factor (ECF subfamily)